MLCDGRYSNALVSGEFSAMQVEPGREWVWCLYEAGSPGYFVEIPNNNKNCCSMLHHRRAANALSRFAAVRRNFQRGPLTVTSHVTSLCRVPQGSLRGTCGSHRSGPCVQPRNPRQSLDRRSEGLYEMRE
jgi:hypothetical protein